LLRFAVRKQVDTANSERLARLPGQLYEYQAKDDGEEAKIEQACVASKLLQLKIGAQVMLLKNTSNSLVNGSMGIVVGFAGERDYSHENNSNGQMSTKRTKHDRGTKPPNPIVRFMNGEQITVAPEVWTIELPSMFFVCLFVYIVYIYLHDLNIT
jgi:ATP-dependent DNA helicase PIF1